MAEQAEPLAVDNQADTETSKRFAFVGEPWDQQPNETKVAYAAFVCYRDMGAARSNAKVGRKLGKTKSLMDRWSSEWKWVIRAEEWDAELDREYRAELIEQRRAMALRHTKNAVALQTVAMEALKKKFGPNFSKLTKNSLKDGDLLRFFIEAAKMERTALGEPGEIVEQQVTGGVLESDRKPFIPITQQGRIDAALAALETIRARIAGGTAGPAD